MNFPQDRLVEAMLRRGRAQVNAPSSHPIDRPEHRRYRPRVPKGLVPVYAGYRLYGMS